MAEVKGSAVYIDVKSGRPVDIRTLGGGWPRLYEGFTQKSENSRMLKQKWDNEHTKFKAGKATTVAKI